MKNIIDNTHLIFLQFKNYLYLSSVVIAQIFYVNNVTWAFLTVEVS